MSHSEVLINGNAALAAFILGYLFLVLTFATLLGLG